jgi:hypothetical protein
MLVGNRCGGARRRLDALALELGELGAEREEARDGKGFLGRDLAVHHRAKGEGVDVEEVALPPRRHVERDGPLGIGRAEAPGEEARDRHVAAERAIDELPHERPRVLLEQRLGGEGCAVARALGAAGRIAGMAGHELTLGGTGFGERNRKHDSLP